MKIKTIALLGLAGMLAVACGDDAKTKGSLAVTVQLASDLTDVTTVQITALSEADFDAADVTAAAEKLAELDVSGTTLGQVVKELKAGTYRITASAYAGDATVDGASRTAEVTVKADGVVLVALTLSGSTDLVIGGITASDAAPKTGDVVTLTADVSGNAGGSLVWTDNCDGDYVTNGANVVEWSSAYVESCTLTLTATNPATSATATINLAVGGAKGSLERVVGNGFCHYERTGYSCSNDCDGNENSYYGGRVLDGTETARNFPLNALAGIDVDASGNIVFIEQLAGRVWKYNPATDTLVRLSGATDPDTNDADVHGDEGPAVGATFEMPMDVDVAPNGDIYVADAWDNEIRRIFTDDATITTIPMSLNSYAMPLAVDSNGDVFGGAGYSSYNLIKLYANTNTQFTLNNEDTWDIEIYDGYVYATSRFEHGVYKMPKAGGAVTYLAGITDGTAAGNLDGTGGYTGDGGNASGAGVFEPRGLYIDQSNGNIYFADYGNGAIRMITQAGKISTVLSNVDPGDVVMDSAKNLYYTDRSSCSVVKVYGPY